jgi:hypothetical protein
MNRIKRLTIIWKVFAFHESRLSDEFVADLVHLSEAQVVFILESHKQLYQDIIDGKVKGINNRTKATT